MSKKIVAVLPAYRAEKTLKLFLNDLPKVFDKIILVDDASDDSTFEIARAVKGISVYRNAKNLGYGGNMKRCLKLALDEGADIIVEIHPDGEYGFNGITPALEKINKGASLVLGNRFENFNDALKAGMFFWKYPVNKALNFIDNLILQTRIPDLHQGFRVYTRVLLKDLNFNAYSDDFLFTFQIICESILLKKKIDIVKITASYKGKKRGVNFTQGVRYTFGTFLILGKFLLSKLRKIF